MTTKRFSSPTWFVVLMTAAGLTVACGSSPEDQVPNTESAVGTASAASTEDCDADGDGFLAARCGGNDCCDTDASTYPGSAGYFPMRNACGNYDYNCDGYEEPFTGVGVACHKQGLHCAGGGFVTVTPCGVENTFVDCHWKFGCKEIESRRLQECH